MSDVLHYMLASAEPVVASKDLDAIASMDQKKWLDMVDTIKGALLNLGL